MEEKLFFENSKGQKICGIISNPTNSTNTPIIILLHGFSSNKNSSSNKCLTKELNKKNIATFRFDFYGLGESEGDFGDTTITEAVDETKQAIEFLKEKNYTKIGIIGSSFGGITGFLTTAQTPDLFVLAVKCPVSHSLGALLANKNEKTIKEWEEKGFIPYNTNKNGVVPLKYTLYEDSKQNNAQNIAHNIKVPTLIVHGDADTIVPIEHSKKTAELIPNCKLEIIQEAGHRFEKKEHWDKMITLLVDFVDMQVKKL